MLSYWQNLQELDACTAKLSCCLCSIAEAVVPLVVCTSQLTEPPLTAWENSSLEQLGKLTLTVILLDQCMNPLQLSGTGFSS